MQAKLDAQSQVLSDLVEQLEISGHAALLTRTTIIKQDQDRVRRAAIDTGEHGLAREQHSSKR